LQGYRIGGLDQELKIFAGLTIDVPSLFIGGKSDWGVYQTPGGLEAVEQTLTTQYKGTVLVEGAGHWVQQEQAEQVSKIFIDFLRASLAH
jgi:pimeloyl-ACP methyl ester carboxylesterase